MKTYDMTLQEYRTSLKKEIEKEFANICKHSEMKDGYFGGLRFCLNLIEKEDFVVNPLKKLYKTNWEK